MTTSLFAYYLALFLGGLALLYISFRQYRKTGDPLLLAYTLYLLAVSATSFDSVLGQSVVSLTSKIRLLSPASISTFSKMLCLLSLPFLFVSWYFFMVMIVALIGRKIGRGVWFIYWAAQTVAAVAYVVTIIHFVSPPTAASAQVYKEAIRIISWTGCFVRFLAIAQIFVYQRTLADRGRRRWILWFGGISAALQVFYYGLYLLPRLTSVSALLLPLALFLREYAPLFLLFAMLRREFQGTPAATVGPAAMRCPPELPGLTEREREIVGLMLAGKNNVEIHKALFISPGTVRNHVSNIYRKLGLKSRYQLLAMARKE